jgi:N-acetylneuraminic acid mutarotase
MRKLFQIIGNFVLFTILFGGTALHGQGTAFTYQGRLQDGTNHATGSYDISFSVWNNAAGASQVGSSVTNLAIGVTNGLFTVTLDFGLGIFDGTPRWLEINMRTNGNGAFSTLSPRQALTAAPYAIHAGGVSAVGISGTIPTSSIGNGTITSNMLAGGAAAANLAISGQSSVPSGGMVLSSNPSATNLTAAGYMRFGGQLDMTWQQIAAAPVPTARMWHSAVWTGNKMIIWGGGSDTTLFNTGSVYDPALNTWTPTSTNGAPLARGSHTAVWTGTEMIIWGGTIGGGLNFSSEGARYRPDLDTWTPVSTNSAPVARTAHRAVWTGAEMIVWGGSGTSGNVLDTGSRYSPATDTWMALSDTNAPSARAGFSMVCAGSKLIIWGGGNNTTVLNSGSVYDQALDAWTTMTTNGAPIARSGHTAVWTGSEMIVWGGEYAGWRYSNNAARYNPQTDVWSPVANSGAPLSRRDHTAVWAGSEMLVWGGNAYDTPFLNTGGRYDPAMNKWTPMATSAAPSGRFQHSCIWSGGEMILFGGTSGGASNFVIYDDIFSYAPERVMFLYLRP